MKEILFRGKRVDNGEWAYGYYVKAKSHWHKRGIHEDWIVCEAYQNGGWFALGRKYAVRPETVGQYTGLNDENDKKIFEGDIVEVCTGSFKVEYWDSGWGCCVLADNEDAYDSMLSDYGGIKVVGNIHDKEETKK